MKYPLAIAAICVVCSALPASAHHSLAAYNMATFKTVEGTVKSFQWMNPHAKLSLVAMDDSGRATQWEFEGGSIGRLTNGGFVKDAFGPGDKVKVAYNPRRDGRTSGFFIAVTTADGRTYAVDRFKQLNGSSQPTVDR
jgi:hypothetical protein